MSKLFGFLYGLVFFALAAGSFAAMYFFIEPVFWFYISMLVMMALRHGLGVKIWITKWADYNMTSLDQTWQVLFAPILNIGVTTNHKFGHPDETASSVVGKNLRDTGLFRWKFIEKIVSILLEGGKPHSIPSIED